MNKLILILLIILNFSCSSTLKKRVVTDSGVQSVEVGKEEIDSQKPLEVVEVKEDHELLQVIEFTNFKQKEIDRFWLANNLMNKVVNSDCFESFISKRNIIQTNGLSKKDIIKLLRGKKPKLAFEMYYSLKGVVGYTYPNSDRIWMNRRLHKNFSITKKTANLAHEISHKLGFKHDFKRTKRRPFSVPYSVGAGIEACSDE